LNGRRHAATSPQSAVRANAHSFSPPLAGLRSHTRRCRSGRLVSTLA
jgi:hypothetical protein